MPAPLPTPGAGERKRLLREESMSGMRAAIARNMMQSLTTSAQISAFAEWDLTELLKLSGALRAVPFSPEFMETGTLALARELFGRFAFQFELLSLVILASIVGAVVLAAKRRTAP